MSYIWRGTGRSLAWCVLGAILIYSGSLSAADFSPPDLRDYPGSLAPHVIETEMPSWDIPLPEEGAEEEAFKGLKIPAKRERLPDERTIKVAHFQVGRLMPKQQVTGKCVETGTEGFCLVQVEDPELDKLLQSTINDYQSQFTIFDLEDVALRVTNFFRSRDLILDTAFIPPQDVQDDRVQIHVLQGRLGKLAVKGNEHYKTEILQAPFEDLIGQPVTRGEVTHALLTVWDYPRLSLADKRAQLTFFPGSEVGETDIEMEVFEEARLYNISFGLDNAGSEYSGIYRGSLNVDFNNLTGGADQLSLTLLGNANPTNGYYYALDYRRPLFTPDYKISMGVYRNDFELGQEFEGWTGVAEEAYIAVERVFLQSFRSRLSGWAKFSRKNADSLYENEVYYEDKLAPLELMIDSMVTDQWLAVQGVNQTRTMAGYTHGFGDLLGAMEAKDAEDSSRTLGSGEKAGAEFDKLNLGITRKQAFFGETALWFRLNGQYTADALVSIEQMSLGGPSSVRAYPTAEYLRDKGYFVSLEWSANLPFGEESMVPSWLSGGRQTSWGNAITFSLFADYAEGWLNDPIPSDEESVTLDGAGIGLNFQTPRVTLNMTLATPLGDKEPSNGNDPQFFAHLLVQF